MQRVLFRCTVHECLSNKLTSVHFLKPRRKPCDLLDNIHLSILNVHVIDTEVLFTFTTRKHLALSRSSILHTLGYFLFEVCDVLQPPFFVLTLTWCRTCPESPEELEAAMPGWTWAGPWA